MLSLIFVVIGLGNKLLGNQLQASNWTNDALLSPMGPLRDIYGACV